MSQDTQEQNVASSNPAEDLPAVSISRVSLAGSFFVLYMLFALDFAARIGISAAFPGMQKDLGLTDGQLGLIGSCVLLGMTLFVMPVAYVADKGAKKKSIFIMGLVWGVGSLVTGVASGFFAVLSGRFMVGMGNAGYAPVSVSMLTSWVRKSRWGLLIGLYNSSMNVGIAFGTAVSGFLAVQYGWRSTFYVLGAASILFSLLALLLPKVAENGQGGAKVSMAEAASVTLKNKTILLFGLGAGCIYLVFTASVAWLPMFLVRYMGWSSEGIGARLGGVYLLTGLLVPPLSGFIGDKFGRWDKRTRAWIGVPCALIAAAAAVLAFTTQSFFWILISLAFQSMPIAAIHVGTQELVPARYKASSYGTYVMIIQGCGIAGPMLTGFLSQSFDLQKALIYIQSVLLLTAASLLIAGFTYMQDYNKARSLEEALVA